MQAEQGVLVVHIKDLHDHPIDNVRLRAGDSSISAPSHFGEARIKLAPQTKPEDVVMLEIVGYPPGKDLVFISPWDKWTHVPPFDNAAKNFIPITLAERGDRACLEDSACIRAAAAQINKENAPKSAGPPSSEAQNREALERVAKMFGLTPNDIDQAIRAWGERADDPYDKGLAALYEKRYPEATAELEKSFSIRKKAEADARDKTAEAAFFLGQSLYEQGRFRDSAQAYEEARLRRPFDAMVLNNLALSWARAGDFASAEPLFRRALAINRAALGEAHPVVAKDLNNLGQLLEVKGDYSEAEPLLRQALAIDEKALGPDHPDVAMNLNNLAILLRTKGDYAEAEPLFRRALAILEKTLGPNHLNLAKTLNNFAQLLQLKGDYAGAELLYRRALTIDETVLGPEHPDRAAHLNNLASLLQAESDYAGAEALYRLALAINEKALGPDHPDTAADLNNLGFLLQTKGDYAAAEQLYRQALAIDEKALGPDHPDVARTLNNLAVLLHTEGDYAGAEPLYRRAVAIDEKALGPEHPDTRAIRADLEKLLQAKAKRSPSQ
ncbi:MAG: tetratricopeptide repeat protein [Acidobacteriaceae bacterium]|nr:tetratricopeptide repeat protein [Acidobacteriaceae bacterium]